MFRKKLMVISAFLFGCAFIGQAQNAIRLTDPAGQETVFLLSSNPKVTMETDGSLLVTTDTQSISLEASTYRLEFIDSNASVKSIEGPAPVFNVSSDYLEASNLEAGCPVMIYDMQGRLVKSASADQNGSLYLSLSDLLKGIYVVNSNMNKFKFYKK